MRSVGSMSALVLALAAAGCSGGTTGSDPAEPPGQPPPPPPPSGPKAYLLVDGVKFLPDWLSTAWQLNPAIAVRGTDVYFSDSSETPLKRLSVTTGAVTPLARKFGVPVRVALQGRRILWTDGPRLRALALDTGVETVLASGNLGVTPDLLADGAAAYWVRTLPVSTCSPPCNFAIERVDAGGAVTLAEVQGEVLALAQDATTIYWEEHGAVKSVPKAGGPVSLLVDGFLNGLIPLPEPGYIPGGWRPVGGLAVEGATVTFAETEFAEHRVLSVPASGGPVAVLASLPKSNEFDQASRPVRLRSRGGNPLWIDASGLRSLSAPGGGVVTLLDGLVGPVELQVAEAGLLVSDAGTLAGLAPATGAGRVQLVPRDGGPATVVAQGLDAPGPLAADGATAYWGEIWRIGSAPLSGGPSMTLSAGITADIPQFGLGLDALIVADGPLLKRVPLDGGMPGRVTPLFSATPAPYVPPPPSDLVLDSTSAWVAFPGGGVSRIPLDGSARTDFAVPGFASPMDCPSRVVLEGDRVYWSSGPRHQSLGCAIASAPRSGGPITVLVEGPGIINDFTVSAGELWFTTQTLVTVGGAGTQFLGSESVNHMPAAGGPVTTMRTPGFPAAIALDGTRAYWLDLVGNMGILFLQGGSPDFAAVGYSRWDSLAYDRVVAAGGGAVATRLLYGAIIYVAP